MDQSQHHLPHQLRQAPPSDPQTTPQHLLEARDGVQRRIEERIGSVLEDETTDQVLLALDLCFNDLTAIIVLMDQNRAFLGPTRPLQNLTSVNLSSMEGTPANAVKL